MLQCVFIRKLTLHPIFEHTAIFNPFSPVFQFIQKPVISFAQQKHFLVSIWNETPRNATLDWNGLKELMPRQMNYLATFKHYFIAILRCKHRALLNVEFGMISLKQKLIVLVKTRQQFPLVYIYIYILIYIKKKNLASQKPAQQKRTSLLYQRRTILV